jgi:glycosyltransferase involved in cell wall biosynthesis
VESTDPLISIITISFNSQETIRDAIESVLSQDYGNIEYLIIDGASTDNTPEIIKTYRDHIAILVSEPDNGIYDAMNKGIRLSHGEVVGFLNSDDILANPHVISSIARRFYTNEVDATYGDLVYVDRLNTDKVVRYWRPGNIVESDIKYAVHPPHPTFYVRKNILDKCGLFDTQYSIAADVDLMIRLLGRCQIRADYIPEILVKMRMGGVTNKNLCNIMRQNIEIRKSLKANKQDSNLFMFVMKKLASRLGQYISKPEHEGHNR